jgi:hypothetical protein
MTTAILSISHPKIDGSKTTFPVGLDAKPVIDH